MFLEQEIIPFKRGVTAADDYIVEFMYKIIFIISLLWQVAFIYSKRWQFFGEHWLLCSWEMRDTLNF